MTADELQAAIDRAEAERRVLESQQPATKASAKVVSIGPRAAELYRPRSPRASRAMSAKC